MWNYKPVSKYINMDILKKSNKLSIIQFSDAIYFGEILGGRRDGIGIMKYDNNRFY